VTKIPSHYAEPRVDNVVDRAHELALILRLKAREVAAFDEIYEAYRARLYSFLVRLTRRCDIAEEMLQETWLRLATRGHLLRDDTHLCAWLFTVAHNLFVSYCRNRLLDAERIGELNSMPAPVLPSPFESAAASETERRLERAIALLPAHYREVLLLTAAGITHDEAAVICELRPDAFRKRLSRAREQVSAALCQSGGDYDAGN
jgi:RNA polymerase sigma factor (sigma-70 family)